MGKTVDLVLGDKTFQIESPLTFKQLRVVEPAILRVLALRKSGSTEEAYDEMAKVIVACVAKVDPTFTLETLDNTNMFPDEVTAAFHAIGLASGLLVEKKAGETAPGEAQAETQSPSTGE